MRDYSRVTFMFCLPRSRSQWFAWLINKSSNTVAWHDPLKRCAHPNTLVLMIDKFLDENPDKRLFIADTAAVLFFKHLTTRMHNMSYFFVHRNVSSVVRSMEAQTGRDIGRFIIDQSYYLNHVSKETPSIVFPYTKLTLMCVRRIWGAVTAGDDISILDLNTAMATVIDTPVREQTADPQLVRSLLAYRENA